MYDNIRDTLAGGRYNWPIGAALNRAEAVDAARDEFNEIDSP